MTERLFVCGTLGPGRPNEQVIDAIGGSWESATVNGTLRQEGWDATVGKNLWFDYRLISVPASMYTS